MVDRRHGVDNDRLTPVWWMGGAVWKMTPWTLVWWVGDDDRLDSGMVDNPASGPTKGSGVVDRRRICGPMTRL